MKEQVLEDQFTRLTVKCPAGIGNDNVQGTVEEKGAGGSLTPVEDAEVTVSNTTAGEIEDTTTNRNGVFDVDVDAACNHRITVRIKWKDSAKRTRIFIKTFSCICEEEDEEEHGAAELSLDERFARLERAEALSDGMAVETRGTGQGAAIAQFGTIALLGQALNALAGEAPDQQKERLDKEFARELEALGKKLEQFGPVPPPPDQQWAIIQDLFKLLEKLVAKAFLIQGIEFPRFPTPEWKPNDLS